ncbi:20563_t:CDS:2 [Gigaspora margarita]|uniref:20563_t:CDS:1 n=1 Tax=Gigaspora margarita TaxID=4874 RepID=A0ABN7UDJ1_GIGMA|nr:20563_t:CDS:2 [Gigaspora margarita]
MSNEEKTRHHLGQKNVGFISEIVDIDSNDKKLEFCINNIKQKIETLYNNSASKLNEVEWCHASIHIARKITNKIIIPKCQFEITVLGNERCGRVDYIIEVKIILEK